MARSILRSRRTLRLCSIFGKEPILSARASFYFPVKSDLSFSTIESAPDSIRIGLITDYEYGDKYELHRKRFNEERVANQTQIIQMLKNHRVDVVIMFDEVADHTMSQMKLNDESIVKGDINHVSDFFVDFNKNILVR
jgi:polar amino acid transport system substrate-binding protein